MRLVLPLVLLACLAACGGGSKDPGQGTPAPIPTPTPIPTSDILLIPSGRLATLKADVAAGHSAWTLLKQNVENNLGSTSIWDTGAENYATAYLVSGDKRYADRAVYWAQTLMAQNLSRDSYYDYGSIQRGVALTLNYCRPALSADQILTFSNFLHASADELWNHNKGSGWGLDNPRNNYHQEFLMGTAFAGYALRASGDSRGTAWIDLVNDRLKKAGGVLDYLRTGVPGGDWDEGVNYGLGSKMHLMLTLSLVKSMGGEDYFNTLDFTQNLGRFALYAVQPGGTYIYPGGDMARDSAMPATPYDRAVLQPAAFFLAESDSRKINQWYLKHIVTTYLDGGKSFNDMNHLYLEMLYHLDSPELNPTSLPLSYQCPTTKWTNLRSGWDDQATSLTISGSPKILESHQHRDTGSFTLWKKDWQAAHSSTYSHSGLINSPEGHNLLRVPGQPAYFSSDTSLMPGMLRFGDFDTYGYAQVDSTHLYRGLGEKGYPDLLNEHTRELVYLRPNTLVVFDRVEAAAGTQPYAWCLHFPISPTLNGNGASATYKGGAMSLLKLVGGVSSIVSDMDLDGGSPVSSFRVEEAATGATSRYLNVLEVAIGAAPATTATAIATPGAVQGLLLGTTVLLFSDLPKGAMPALPFTYTVPGTASLRHLLFNMSGNLKVQAVQVGGNTVVTVSTGGSLSPNAQGVISVLL